MGHSRACSSEDRLRGQAEDRQSIYFFSNYTAVSWFEGFQLRRQTLAANDTCDSYTNSKLWRYTLRHRQSWRMLGCARTLATRFWYGSWQKRFSTSHATNVFCVLVSIAIILLSVAITIVCRNYTNAQSLTLLHSAYSDMCPKHYPASRVLSWLQ